jgi:hypothetical protein
MRALLLLAACSAPHDRAPLSNQHPIADRPALEIAMTRTMCFGSCPAYTVKIHADGRVDWQGDSYVHVKGPAHATLSADQLATISAEIDRVNFFGTDGEGRPASAQCKGNRHCVIVSCTDTSHTTIAITRGTQHHEIDNSHCYDQPVDHLEIVIDKAANTERWIGTGSQP